MLNWAPPRCPLLMTSRLGCPRAPTANPENMVRTPPLEVDEPPLLVEEAEEAGGGAFLRAVSASDNSPGGGGLIVESRDGRGGPDPRGKKSTR